MTDTASTPMVEVRHVSKAFGNVQALHDVSLAVYPGQVHCLLGDNGAGKSTLIKILSGVHPPDTGEMLIAGQPVRFSSPRDALRAGIPNMPSALAELRHLLAGRQGHSWQSRLSHETRYSDRKGATLFGAAPSISMYQRY